MLKSFDEGKKIPVIKEVRAITGVDPVPPQAEDSISARLTLRHMRDRAAALEAVKQWVYEPTVLNGQPVPVIMAVTVNFRLPPPPFPLYSSITSSP